MNTHFKPGVLVSMHHREWVVLPSPHEDVLRLKPLGGTDREIKGVHRLAPDYVSIEPTNFPLPTVADLGPFASAKLLFEAARLSFRSGAGPFRSMGRLAFQPRAYQLVPLIMALRLPVVRLLIADDVGIGKTIEALMIVRELYDRGEIKRFAVVCLPHLCDQWAQELKDKFDLEAAVIRSGTVKKLERQLSADESLFEHFPFQVISIDYIKGEGKRELFLNHAPELVIVDEAHTCSSPGEGRSGRSQRHRVVKALSKNPDQHLILLTATPHSGKPEEFQSILGLLKPEFEALDLTQAEDKEKREVARHFVQRRRKNVEKWMNEKTPFPERSSLEASYELSGAYREVFQAVLKLARNLATKGTEQSAFKQQLRYYLAIGLLRGVMSSPAMGATMLQNRLGHEASSASEAESLEASLPDTVAEGPETNHILDDDTSQDQDQAPTEFAERADVSRSEREAIRDLANKVAALSGLTHDLKAKAALEVLQEWMQEDHVIIFCRYIQTANYLGEILTPELQKTFKNKLVIEVVTSELSDIDRKERITALASEANKGKRKLLIATDCMSEGINLQEQFSAVMHYDLPWNPNRLEQREGRIDRFGQPEPTVKTLLLYGKDNPMDGTVLKVLLRKAREIRKATGVAVPFPDDSQSIMDAVLTSVLLRPQKTASGSLQAQLDFGEDDVVQQKTAEVEESFQRIQEREKQITSVFAQNKIKPNELAPYLHETERVIGNTESVRQLLHEALPLFHTSLEKHKKGFRIATTNLPSGLKSLLPAGNALQVSFASPTPSGYHYLSRNHSFVEALCLQLLDAAFSTQSQPELKRVAVYRSAEVKERTVMYLLRVRNVISNANGQHELVAEELKLWGFRNNPVDGEAVFDAPEELYKTPSENVAQAEKEAELKRALSDYYVLRERLMVLASDRADYMVRGHEHFRKRVKGDHYKRVEPVLPPDCLGAYIILPDEGESASHRDTSELLIPW